MKWICLIGNSLTGAKAITDLGFKVCAFVDKTYEISGNFHKTVDHTIASDLQDSEILTDKFTALTSLYGAPAAIVNFSENGQFACEFLRQKFGYSHNSLDTVSLVNNKLLMRHKLNEINTQFVEMEHGSSNTIFEKLLHRNFPAHGWVIKPSMGAGSLDISFIKNNHELQEWYETYSKSITPWIVEERLIGREFSVESISISQEVHILGITEKITNNHAAEIGHIFPAKLMDTEVNTIHNTVKEALKKLNISFGATHTEVILSSETQCRIIETHLRPGGDKIPYLLKSVTGLCQYRMSILASLNEIKRIEVSESPKSKYACITLFEYKGDKTGLISQVNIDRYKNVSIDKLHIELNFSAIVTPTRNSFNRYGFIIYNTDTYETAKKLCVDSQNLLRIEVDGSETNI